MIQEDIKLHGGNIALPARVQDGENIRRRGEDFRAGDMLYERGRRLSAFDLALMAPAAQLVINEKGDRKKQYRSCLVRGRQRHRHDQQ